VKKLWITATATVGFLLLALPALAQYPGGDAGEPGGNPGSSGGSGAIGGSGSSGGSGYSGGSGDGLAVTGIEVSVGLIILVALVVAGTVLLVVSRRRKIAAVQ
jgi:hypothetical protein